MARYPGVWAPKMAQPEYEITDVPPSAKLVLKVLEYNDGLTQKEIVDRTRLSQRTVRDAVKRLQDRGIVEKGIYVPDARQNLYTLSEAVDDTTPEEGLSTD